MAQYQVQSTFAPSATVQAATHGAALDRYLVEHENRTGWSYPEESAISVRRGAAAWRNYVCVDGFFERD
ncbi:hypothetical protein [Mesorhizobium sp. M1B.F.Ca.ET.045.04.1.1]|uniref:hypothetical protein n=1 Tax=Mesorhizobium sp. M1B.F.Ca.ET.045.04.1.1 TaxID=2493673 RepID=UPI000F753621|nr:hypothetical protein [Mesorhizobium sp. M1B.F.Ca.ET.045.04.1.1]AZO29372.1 hypothetical protein EJ071_19595 [Mesorhizobium sp. M1B.F.Ca.ET.045.04.1.1]